MAKVAHVVIYSGGMDSFTLLHRILNANNLDHIYVLTFDYNQRHRKEIVYAIDECNRLGLHNRHHLVHMSHIAMRYLKGSALTSDIPVPEGHYQADNMRQTVVPGRNAIMLSIAAGYAESLCMTKEYQHAYLYYGAHSGDHYIYPDCRPDFVYRMEQVIHLSSDFKVSLVVPYLRGNKTTILAEGFKMGLDYSRSWTCYVGGEKPCGKCGACQERLAAFAAHNVDDPLDYKCREIIKDAQP